MYKYLPLLLLVYCLAITNDDIYDESWVLFIGIDKYDNLKNLNYVAKDAKTIESLLVNKFEYEKEIFKNNKIS